MDAITPRAPWWVRPTVALILFCVGLTTGWVLYGPKPIKAGTYAASAVQSDGSLIVERTPDALAKPVMQVPAGGKVERIVQVKVRANPVPAAGSLDRIADAGNMVGDCPPVTLDLALVRMQDQSRRVIASSPDGQIVGGVDIPVENATQAEQPKWAAGLSHDTQRRSGIWLDRDIGPFRAGLAARQSDSGGVRGEMRIGVRF